MNKIIMFFIMFSICLYGQKQDLNKSDLVNVPTPEWFDNLPQSEDYIYFAGVGETKVEALLLTLSGLRLPLEETTVVFKSIDSTSESIGNTSQSSVSTSFGKLKISSLTKFVEEEGEYPSSMFSNIVKMTYSDSTKKMVVQLFQEEQLNGVDHFFESTLEVVSKNCSLKEIFNELKSQGAIIKFEVDDNNFYLLIGYPKDKLSNL